MLAWTIALLVLAILAALFGFVFIAGVFAGVAKMLFAVFLVLFLLSLYYWRRGVR